MWLRFRRDETELRLPNCEHPLPEQVLLGAATASHQVEGYDVHSDWWRFERLPGRVQRFAEFPQCVQDGKSNHWRHYREDVERMAGLGLQSYRFSIDWSRVEPEEGRFDDTALDQYADLCQRLRTAGIRPCVTLFHWSSPDWIWDHDRERETGWYDPKIVQRFERFVRAVATRLAPWVDLFVTLNEPNIFLYGGFNEGILCPGHRNEDAELVPLLRHILQCHVAAVRVLREVIPQASIGVAHHFCCIEPWRRWNPISAAIAALTEYGFTWAMPDAFRTGKMRIVTRRGRPITEFIPGLAGSCDFLGMNYYERWFCQFGKLWGGALVDVLHPHKTDKDIWPNEINTRRFVDMMVGAWKRYKLPIYITENGISHPDDAERSRFLRQHLCALSHAIARGVDVRGYFYWSLLDNQEWANGFATRMGLFAVDYETGERRLRPVGQDYANVIRSRVVAPAEARLKPAAVSWQPGAEGATLTVGAHT